MARARASKRPMAARRGLAMWCTRLACTRAACTTALVCEQILLRPLLDLVRRGVQQRIDCYSEVLRLRARSRVEQHDEVAPIVPTDEDRGGAGKRAGVPVVRFAARYVAVHPAERVICVARLACGVVAGQAGGSAVHRLDALGGE